MNALFALPRALRAFRAAVFPSSRRLRDRGASSRPLAGLLLATGLLAAGAAQARVVATAITVPPDIGRDQIVDIQIDWTRTTNGSGDKISTSIPPQLAVNPPPPPAGCTYTAPNMVCDVPDGNAGATGSITFQVRGQTLGGFNMTATGTSPPAATSTATVRSTGDLRVGKIKSSPVDNPVTGGTVVFTLTPQITSGDDVPTGAQIVVTDHLPGTATDFNLANVTFSGRTPTCNSTANANSTRTLTCTYAGPFTRAQLNASAITVTGTAGNSGAFTNTAAIDSGNGDYFDSDPANNSASVDYTADPGTDIEALGTFPSTPQTVGTPQNLVLTHRNNGPLANPAGGSVQTVVPATFTLGTLPAGCTQTSPGSLVVGATTYNGTLVSCAVGVLAVGASQNFTLPLTLPAAAEASSFPVVVTPPPGRADANPANNSKTLPYQIVNAYADLTGGKSKSKTGPQPPGTVVTTTLQIRNDSNSPSAATYDAAHPLRIVDYARPEEVAGGVITNVSAGWNCVVATGVTPPSFIGDSNKTTRIACTSTGSGTLAPGAGPVSVSFDSTIATVTTPVTLTDRACTGSQALTALGLPESAGPQPADGGHTSNDCADAGGSLVATQVVSGHAQVSIKKESSVNNVDFFDPVGSAPTLAANASTLYWRMTITTPTTAANTSQEAIPTLTLTDNLPGILNANSTGAPAPSFRTPAINATVAASGATAACSPISGGSGDLRCTFKNVQPGALITVTVPVSRPLSPGTLENTATLTSPDAILSASAGGKLQDDAAVVVTPRTDLALTTKTVSPATPLIGQVVSFTITAENLGEDTVAAGNFTITDTLFTGTPTAAMPAYEVLEVTAANAGKINCAASNLATGAISCTNTSPINRYETQTITIRARIKKPANGIKPADQTQYSGVTNTASVALGGGMCEWRVETSTTPVSTSAACNDAASTSNNSKIATFDIKVPAIDLQQGKVAIYPTGQTQFLIGDQLRYRFSVRNSGPSRAEDIVMTDILTIPAGFHLSMAGGAANINAGTPTSGYALAAKAVSCTQVGPDANVVCRLNADPTLSYLDANQEVNFEIAMTMDGTAMGPVTFGNKAYVCADETNTYETSGKCSSDPADAGNNMAAVNNVVFPKADLEVVSKTAVTPSPADIAQPIEYAIVLRNNGSAGTPQMRLTDTLPTGFEWVHGDGQAPAVSVDSGSAATLSASGGVLAVSASVPANGSENVCYISNGVTNVTALNQQQAITCVINGLFPAGPGNTITLKLYARAKPELYDGSANAPYLTDRTNTARVYPGRDVDGNDISIDDKPDNDSKTGRVQVRKASIGGRVFVDLNKNGDQNGTTLATDQGVGAVTITLTGTDKYGNSVSRTVTTKDVPAGNGSLRGDYLFDNLAPSDAAGYTITMTQPAGYMDAQPQPNTPRPVRNGSSSNVSGTYVVNHDNSTSTIGGVVLGAAATGVQFDFPVVQESNLNLSGYVYLDANNNGTKDGAEAGIGSVTITLIGCGSGPDGVLSTPGPIGAGPVACAGDDIVVNKTATTAADGSYNFMLDQPGRYSVIQQTAQPVVAGVTTAPGKTTAGSVDRISSAAGANDGGTRGTVNTTGNSVGGSAGVLQEVNGSVPSSQIRDVVINDSAARSPNNNFGEVLAGSIAGVVYTEKGAPNSNYEPGVDWPFPGVTVTLTGTDDLGQTINLTTTTQANGSYIFENLRPGTYTVTKTNPVRTPAVVNENHGAYPGNDGTPRGTYVNADTINAITLVSGAKIVQTNFAVLNGTDVKFKLVKTFTGTLVVGQPAVYTLTVTNNGSTPTVGSMQFGDLLPGGMSLAAANPVVSAAGTVSNVVTAGQLVTFDFEPATPIGPGSSVAITVNVTVAEAALGNVVNYAVVSGGGDPHVPTPPGPGCADTDHCASVPSVVSGPPLLSLTKTGPKKLILGTTADYLLTVKNGGESATVGVLHLIEKLPPGLSLNGALSSPDGAISNVVSSGDVDTGLTVNFDLTPTVPLAATTGKAEIKVPVTVGLKTQVGVATNYASVGGGGDIRTGGVPPTPGSACSDMRCANLPSDATDVKLKLVKTFTGPISVGQPAIYTLTVSNVGQTATNSPLQFSDLLPNGMSLAATNPVTSTAGTVSGVTVAGQLVTFSFTPTAPIAPGGDVALTVNVTVAEAALGNVINYAVVSGGGDPYVPTPPGPGCADATHCAKVPALVYGPPLLSLLKTGPETLTLGGAEEYQLTIKNAGESPTVGRLHLIEQLPPGLTLNGELTSPDGVISNVATGGDAKATGLTIKFDFTPNAPLSAANGKAGIKVPVMVGVDTAVGVATNYASVGGGGDIRDGGEPPIPGSACGDPRCANAPSTVAGAGLLAIVKTASKSEAELGDMVSYTLTISNISQATVVKPNIIDRLPAGFRLIENSARVTGATLLRSQGAPGPLVTYGLDLIPPGRVVTLTYRVRLGVGSMQGDGINRARAECPLNPATKCSNEARAQVRVSGGVFTNDACIVGMIYVDCNGNQLKDREELGIPGVRFYVEDGTFLISDSEGKYSFCGLSPKTHVLKADQTTLPRGSRLVAGSNRNVGDGNSLFLDLKNGELQRADFIEGSCSNTVMEQVKARRTQGGNPVPQTEKKGGPALTFEGRAPGYPQQGTDSANQRIVKPRAADTATPPASVSERDTPVPQLEIRQGGRGAN